MSHPQTLSENRSKDLLAQYGVPVIEEAVAADAAEAVKLAERFDYPVVLKAHGARLAHKSERGLVRLGLANADAVRRAADELSARAGEDLEGLLVQPMLSGRREFVAGLFRDRVFGPVVMFGLGGVLTEVLDDVAFRLAPLTEGEARVMIGELRCARLLGAFRGEAPVNEAELVSTLCGLSRLALERPDVAEVDVNPLLVTPEGDVRAVDALVVSAKPEERATVRPSVPAPELGALFHPKSIAFVGASASLGKWGQSLPTNAVAGGYPGTIYLVNPRGGTLWGRPVYPDLGSVPGPVDLAVITIPAAKVLDLVPQMKAKSVPYALVISSGFAEVGGEGRALERELVAAAREAGILLLGPNTMGLVNTHEHLYLTGVHVRPKRGNTALVSQSGNMGVQLLDFSQRQGLGIRAFCGSGNEAMVAVEDFMEAFEVDERTRTVLLYLESLKDGRRFFESAKRVGRKKPVIVLKGGRTEVGERAAASHTGALAGNVRVFDAACRQAGVVSVREPVEMLDASAVFSSLPLPRGRRVAIMTLGGGWGVVTSDLCAARGLTVPPLDDDVMGGLDRLLPPYWSRGNPVDLVGENDPELPFHGLEQLVRWDGCDAAIHLGIFGRRYLLEWLLASTAVADPTLGPELRGSLVAEAERLEMRFLDHVVALMEQHGKPIIGVDLATGPTQRTLYDVADSSFKAVLFPSPERAVAALAHMCAYRDYLTRAD